MAQSCRIHSQRSISPKTQTIGATAAKHQIVGRIFLSFPYVTDVKRPYVGKMRLEYRFLAV